MHIGYLLNTCYHVESRDEVFLYLSLTVQSNAVISVSQPLRFLTVLLHSLLSVYFGERLLD